MDINIYLILILCIAILIIMLLISKIRRFQKQLEIIKDALNDIKSGNLNRRIWQRRAI